MKRLGSLLIVALLVICNTSTPSGADPGWKSIGARGGFGTSSKYYFQQYEAFAIYQLPWGWRGERWEINSQLPLTAGALHGEGATGFIGSVGPAVGIGKIGIPLELDLGVSAAFLSRDTFGERDYNGHALFVSHVGLTYRFSECCGIGYRFQHMSNAGLNGTHNPGVDMHLFGISFFLGR